jgi:spore coat protein A
MSHPDVNCGEPRIRQVRASCLNTLGHSEDELVSRPNITMRIIDAMLLALLATAQAQFVTPFVAPKNIQCRGTISLEITSCTNNLPGTAAYCINGHSPPLLVAERFTPCIVRWRNKLKSHPLIPLNTTIGDNAQRELSTTIHLHGALGLGGDNDGYPLTPHSPGSTQTNWYPNLQPATMLFYHDHSMNRTAFNVYAGLVGGYLIRDAVERKLIQQGIIPSSEFPILISDKSFDPYGNLLYSLSAGLMVGTEMMVNNRVRPYLSIPTGRHRLRILNGCNARFLNLSIPGASMELIGNEVGLFEKPSFFVDHIVLGSGERADVVVDFAPAWKRDLKRVELVNTSPVQYPGPPLPPNTPGYNVMQFRLSRPRFSVRTTGGRVSTLKVAAEYPSLKPLVIPRFNVPDAVLKTQPSVLRNGWVKSNHSSPPSITRHHYLNMAFRQGTGVLHLINNNTFETHVRDVLKVGGRETWVVCNLMTVGHPMHIHGVHFSVIQKRVIDGMAVMRQLMNGSMPTLVYGQDMALSDLEARGEMREMFVSEPNSCTTLDVFVGNFRGDFVWHCHMLEHEDRAMMRKLMVGETSRGGDWEVWKALREHGF